MSVAREQSKLCGMCVSVGDLPGSPEGGRECVCVRKCEMEKKEREMTEREKERIVLARCMAKSRVWPQLQR